MQRIRIVMQRGAVFTMYYRFSRILLPDTTGQNGSARAMFWSWSRASLQRLLVVAALIIFGSPSARCASLSAKDVLIIAKTMGFLEPPCSRGTFAVFYATDNAASRADAEAIATLFGSGLDSGTATLLAKPVDRAALGDGAGFIGVIVADGADASVAMHVSTIRHVPCITASTDAVIRGLCVMSVRAEPKVDITINHAAANAAGIAFLAAFRMLVHEI